MSDSIIESGDSSGVENVSSTESASTENTSTSNIEATGWVKDSNIDQEYLELASKYENPNAMAKDLANANKLIGKKGIIKPGEDASESDWKSYHDALGVPQDGEGYKFDFIGENEEEWVNETVEKFRSMAHKNNLPPEMANGLLQDYISDIKEQQQQSSIEAEKGMEMLKKAHGSDTQTIINLAKSEAERIGIIDKLVTSGLGSNPEMLQLLANSAKQNGKDFAPSHGISNNLSHSTIDDKIKETLNKLSDPILN